MGALSPRYTVEFKQKAVELYRKSGTTYAEVARGLDQLDPPDVEGVLVLRSIREKCAARIEDAAALYERRRPLYERAADVSVGITGKSFEEVAQETGRLLWERGLL